MIKILDISGKHITTYKTSKGVGKFLSKEGCWWMRCPPTGNNLYYYNDDESKVYVVVGGDRWEIRKWL